MIDQDPGTESSAQRGFVRHVDWEEYCRLVVSRLRLTCHTSTRGDRRVLVEESTGDVYVYPGASTPPEGFEPHGSS